jgi:hypothetical protein
MKTVAVTVTGDLNGDQVNEVAETRRDVSFDHVTWREKAAPLKPATPRNIEQLREYGVEFTDIRRFELVVPEDMPLTSVKKLLGHALRDSGMDVDSGEPMTLE